jgi:hypothetical protein
MDWEFGPLAILFGNVRKESMGGGKKKRKSTKSAETSVEALGLEE